MLFRLPFLTLVFALAAFGTPVKRGAAEVESDIQDVNTQSVALDNAVKAFPNSGGTLSQAFDIHQAASKLSDSIEIATNDASVSPNFTGEQSKTIIALVNDIVSVVQSGTSDLVAKESALTALGVGPTAENDLHTLKTNTDAFGAALLAKLTPDTQADGQKALDDIDSALDSAIDVYAAKAG